MLTIYSQQCEINLSKDQVKEVLAIKPDSIPMKLLSTQLVAILKKAHVWFVLSERTDLILGAFSHFRSQLIERISQGIELDSILIALEPLYLYEFSRGKRESQTTLASSSVDLQKLSDVFLYQFAQRMHSLTPLPKQESATAAKLIDSAYKKLWTKLALLLAHENPLACFLSWYLLLLLVFSLPLLISIILVMRIDSTIIIGLFSAPFAGAIAITTTVYTKKHD
jgi:hypothetical protein